MRRTLGVALRVLGAEGPAAARDRFLDRAEEWRRRRAFRPARGEGRLTAPVLNVLATEPARRLGGLQIQLLRRLAREAEQRACALLYPEAGRYRLERQDGARREALELPGPPPAASPALEDAAFETAVLRAVAVSRARAVHVEGVAGIPPASLLRIGGAGASLILSVHDFAPFCPRPDLLERPALSFCGYCADPARCHACLGRDWTVDAGFQSRRRAIWAEAVASARAVIYPSSFLRAKSLELIPGLDPAAHRVIAPGDTGEPPPGVTPRDPSPVRHVAFVGSVRHQKGAPLFEQIVRRLGPPEVRGVRWTVFGGGEPGLLRRLSALPGVTIRGYYRAGTLPRLLRRHRVDLALLLSVTPESYSLTLDECQEAGVPVVAFDHGAIAERIRAHGGGVLVPPAAEGSGVVEAVRDLLAGKRPAPWRAAAEPAPRAAREAAPRAAREAAPRGRHAAEAHLGLYRELGLL